VAVLRTGQEPLRVSPIADRTVGAPAEILVYDPTARTIDDDPRDVTSYHPRLMESVASDPSLPAIAIVGGASGLSSTSGFQTDTRVQFGDPASGALRPEGVSEAIGRVGLSATPIQGAAALVFGGDLTVPSGSEVANAIEMITGIGTSPAKSAPTVVAPPGLPIPTAFHTATSLSGTKVLIAGGFTVSSGAAVDTAAAPLQLVQIDSPTVVTVSAPAAGGLQAVGYHQTTTLGDGRLLLAGGSPAASGSACGRLCAASAASIIDPTGIAIAVTDTGALQVARYGHRQTLLSDGTVLTTGGLRDAPEGTEVLDSVEIYTPYDETYDAAHQAPYGVERPPAAEADHGNPAFPRCLTQAEYQAGK
jgi:hypothetical protein